MRFLTGLALVLAVVTAANAAESGITVVGAGSAKSHASQVEISATVSGEGEVAADASVKYADAKKKALAALDALKITDLEVESTGFAVNQAMDAAAAQRAMSGIGSDSSQKQKVQVTEQLKLRIKNADKMEVKKLLETILKVLDAGRDNGLSIGPGAMNYYQMQMAAQNGTGMNMISFMIPDAAALREQAYKQAIDDARAKATKLAELAGVKLGSILSVQDQGNGESSAPTNYWEAMAERRSKHQEPLSSNMFGDIGLDVHVSVQFEIAK